MITSAKRLLQQYLPAADIAFVVFFQLCAPSRCHLIEEGLGLLQIERVEALGELAIDRSHKIADLILLTLIVPHPPGC